MPTRTSSNLTRGKIWLPRTRRYNYKVLIDSLDVTDDVITGEFISGIVGVETICNVSLTDPNGTYADLYSGGEEVEFRCDLADASATYWKGTLERPTKKFGETFTLELVGSHFQSNLLDITVTKEYTGNKTCDAILKELVDTFLSGYTYVNVTASTISPTIRWNNKPLYDCIIDLCDLAGFDCYVDNSKDFHFFLRESIENTREGVVWNDTLLSISELGADNIDLRNRIIVYGEDEKGLPIIYRTDDAASQTKYGVKEKIVKDSSIKTYARAVEFGDTILADEKEKTQRGQFNCLLLTDINPGDMIWAVEQTQGINQTFRMIKFITRIPDLTTSVVVSKEKTIPLLFKERKLAELAGENVTNPHSMTNSYNFTFDDSSQIDSSLSTSVEVSSGNLSTSGVSTSGTMVSIKRDADFTITKV